ncbi:Nucleotide exchange factor SIL1 [Diplocarpon rosae]|nr:Nucleotide exchange factor SIL1 [Diplocarpon rosae]
MASTNPSPALVEYLEEQSDGDNESLASLETDDGQDHPPEKILAQFTSRAGPIGLIWYLVKWQDCPILRSSWEARESFNDCPWILDSWQIELQNQAEGKSTPFDINAFNQAVLDVEVAERRRRTLRSNMVHTTTHTLFGFLCLSLPVLARAISPPLVSPKADADLICSSSDPKDCYPHTFQPTKDFQIVKEGQNLPPGLHVRMNIWTGLKEARLNIPTEGEGGAIDGILEIPPDQASTEQSIVVVPQPDEEEPKPAIPKDAPTYETAGKIRPPPPTAGDEVSTFQRAMIAVQTEARVFDSALDDLRDLSHDIYYGLEIVKDGPVLEKLICLTLGHGTEKIPARENSRDHKAANILASSIQNNPTALKEVAGFSKMVMHPSCGVEQVKDGQGSDSAPLHFVSMLRSRLGREHDAGALKAKVGAISGLLREPSIRDSFLANRGMELLLAILLKNGEQYDHVRAKVAQLVTDNFLDEGIGAELGVWPKGPVAEAKVCESHERMLEDGCWEHHVRAYGKQEWAQELLAGLQTERAKVGTERKGEL